MKEQHERDIDGTVYKMYAMNPFESSKILTRLLKLLGKPLSQLIQSVDKKEGESILDSDVDKKVLGMAIDELTQRLSEKEVDKLMRDLLKGDLITYETEEGAFKKISNLDSHFGKMGGILHLFKVVKFSLEVNFKDFLSGLAELRE